MVHLDGNLASFTYLLKGLTTPTAAEYRHIVKLYLE